MGAGYGNGPNQRRRQAKQKREQAKRQSQLWDEHADDEQCLRYSDVAQRRLMLKSTTAR